MNEKLKKLREKLGALVTDSRALADKEERTEDEETKLIESLDAIDKLKVQIAQEERLAGFEVEVRKPLVEPIKMDPAVELEIRAGANRAAKRQYASIGEQLLDVRNACSPSPNADAIERLREVRGITGANESIDSEGAYLVQTDFTDSLLMNTYESGLVASRCTPITISSNADRVVFNRIVETSRARGSRYGGIQVYWSYEAGTVTESQPKFGQVELKLNTLFGLMTATDEALADAAALTSFINKIFPNEMSTEIDTAIIRGLGGGQPLGIMNSGCKIAVDAEDGQTAATINAENVIKMRARLWPEGRPNAAFFINQDTEPQLLQLSIAVGTGGSLVYMPAGGLSGKPYDTLLNIPVIPIPSCSTLGTEGDIILADMSQYFLARKGGIEAASSIHVSFIYGQTKFRFKVRVDGKPWWASAITPEQGSNTFSPVITLATRS